MYIVIILANTRILINFEESKQIKIDREIKLNYKEKKKKN